MTRDGQVGAEDVRKLVSMKDIWRSQQAAVLVAAASAANSAGSTVPASPDITVRGALTFLAPDLHGSLAPKQLIAGIREIDMRPIRSAGARAVATFDLDGTSMKGDVLLPYISTLAHRGLLGSSAANDAFTAVLAHTNIDPAKFTSAGGNANALLAVSLVGDADPARSISMKDMFYTAAHAFRGLRVDDAQAAARALVLKGDLGQPPYASRMNDDSAAPGDSVRDVTRALRRHGIEPWIVTYGFDFLARELAPVLGVDPAHVIGSRPLAKNGVFTGELDDPSTLGKGDSIARRIGAVPLIAFGDSGSDMPMFDLTAIRGITVNAPTSMASVPQVVNGTYANVNYRGTTAERPPVS